MNAWCSVRALSSIASLKHSRQIVSRRFPSKPLPQTSQVFMVFSLRDRPRHADRGLILLLPALVSGAVPATLCGYTNTGLLFVKKNISSKKSLTKTEMSV